MSAIHAGLWARLGAKLIKRRQRSTRSDFEECAAAVGVITAMIATLGSCTVKVAVGGLGRTCKGICSIRTLRLGAKAVKR